MLPRENACSSPACWLLAEAGGEARGEAGGEVALAVVVLCDWPVFGAAEAFALHAHAQLHEGRAATLPSVARCF